MKSFDAARTAQTPITSGMNIDSTLEMMLEATFVMRKSSANTPNVDQKRPRVSTHDREIARIGPMPSSTIDGAARYSFVASQAYSTTRRGTPRCRR